ncbi:MAG: hypothetical protein D4R68_06585 [Ignavibacteriales bacterium]|nr:MAG: hypothetical protein D4R68_06585 [Ignavibacteriales bacterium]
MKLFLETLFLLIIITTQLFSQTEHDTSKTLSNKKITPRDKKQLSIKSNSLDTERLHRLEILQDNFKVPLNLKIYQKIFADEKFMIYRFPQEYLNSGLSNDELMIFEQNKSLTKRMLSDIYGEDIIDLKKILETLGITKDQIVMVAAILKFFLSNPIL